MVSVDEQCRVQATISFQILNFKLERDGDVLYRYEDGSLLQEGQLGRWVLILALKHLLRGRVTAYPQHASVTRVWLMCSSISRGSIFCGVEGHTDYGKPVFECSLSIAWRADLLLTPTVPEQENGRQEGEEQGDRYVVESVLREIPAGRARMTAKFLASKARRLVAQGAWASVIGNRGPPSAVLSDTAKFMQCRGPLSDNECAEDRWELHLSSVADDGSEGGNHKNWIAVDLGSESSVIGLFLDWGSDFAHEYDVQLSRDAVTWHTIWIHASNATERVASSMHTVHVIDIRKKGNTNEIVRPLGESARYIRLVIRRGAGTVSLWRVVPIGTRHDHRMKAHTAIHRIQLYLTDKGGNELGVASTVQVIIIDTRPICTFMYLVYSPKHTSTDFLSATRTSSSEHGEQNAWMPNPSCVLYLTTQEQHEDAMFAANASVATARNLLFEEAKKKGINFLYLLFVDGDATLDEIADYGFSSVSTSLAFLRAAVPRSLS